MSLNKAIVLCLFSLGAALPAAATASVDEPTAAIRTLEGSGANPSVLRGTRPVMGSTWEARIIAPEIKRARGAYLVLGLNGFPDGYPLNGDDYFVSPDDQSMAVWCPMRRRQTRYRLELPDDPALLGLKVYAQACIYRDLEVIPTNGLELLIGGEGIGNP